jgi:hypothetical protein
MTTGRWPALALEGWADTYATLHRFTQIVGKTRLALSPFENHWWHVALYLTARGLGTPPLPFPGGAVDIEFDFVDHALVFRTSGGERRSLPLRAEPVCDFYGAYLGVLKELGVTPGIRPVPCELSDATPFPEDRAHAAYDPDAVERWWTILAGADRVFKRFRGRFVGKSSPSHFWWGGFDLACTRFSGRRGPLHRGGIPNLPDWVTQEAYSHECISAGFWPGSVGGPVAEPAFYAYVYPEPKGCPEARVGPAAARYDLSLREWILPYEVVRSAADPEETLIEFLRSTYTAAAKLSGWNRGGLERVDSRAT